MKKWKLTTLALIGISLTTKGFAQPNASQMTSDMQAFYKMLTPDAQKKFLELDTQHRQEAMNIFHSYCKAQSECSGQRERAVEEQYYNQTQERQKVQGGINKP